VKNTVRQDWGRLLVALVIFVGFASTRSFIAGFSYLTSRSTTAWDKEQTKGLRFQYNKSSGEIFFPRENVRYARGDYIALLLGTTDGYNAREILRKMKKCVKKEDEGHPAIERITQSYFLIQQKDGTWSRHLIGYDQYSKSIHRLIAKVQKAIRCQTVMRNMSLQECYVLQHQNIVRDFDPRVEPRPAKYLRKRRRDMFLLYCISLIIKTVGLVIVVNGLLNGEVMGSIIVGTLWFSFTTVCLLGLWLVPDCNFIAPYTPSEPVFGER